MAQWQFYKAAFSINYNRYMILNVPIFGQRDPKWKTKPLGTSSSTLGDFGCLVTCLAMLAKYYGKDTDPDRLNTALVNIKGFAASSAAPTQFNLYKWYEGITKLYTDITITKLQATPYVLTGTDFNAIKAEIDAGRPVILQVDMIPNTAVVDMHFVLLIGYEGDTYYVNDPWYGDKANLTRYGVPAKAIQQYVFHNGPIPVPGNSDTIPVLKTDFERMRTKCDILDAQNPTYAQLQEINKEMNRQLEGEKAQNKSMTEFMQKVASLLGVPASQEEIIGDITSTLQKEQDYDITKRENETLKGEIKSLDTQLATKEGERKIAVDQIIPLTNQNITLKKQTDDLIVERDSFKDLYEKAKASKGKLSAFTKSAMSNYLFKNWFNKNAFAKG